MAGDASIVVTAAGLNLTVNGTSPGATFNLAGNTLSTIGAGNVILYREHIGLFSIVGL